MYTIPIFAFGTLGDVTPIFTVIKDLLNNTFKNYKIIIITHRYFIDTCKLYYNHIDNNNIEYLPIDTKPIEFNDYNVEISYIDQYSKTYDLNTYEVIYIIANLFALDSWLLSLKLQCTCIFIHPNKPIVRNNKDRLDLIATMPIYQPYLYDYLNNQISLENNMHSLQWIDIHEWLWPLLVKSNIDNIVKELLYSGNIDNQTIIGPIFIVTISNCLYIPDNKEMLLIDRYHICNDLNIQQVRVIYTVLYIS